MTIKVTGSGGSIKFNGTGGRLYIPSSGGGGEGGGETSPLFITTYIDGVAQSPVYINEGDIITVYQSGTTFDGKLAQPYDYVLDSTAENKDWIIYDAGGAPNYPILTYVHYLTGITYPRIIQRGDTSGENQSPLPMTFGNQDWLVSQDGNDGVPWAAGGYDWNDFYFKITASGITFTVRWLTQLFL